MRVKMVVMLLAGLAAVLSGACGRSEPSGATGGKVTLALNWVPEPEFGGFYAAELAGAFKKHGLEVTLQPGGKGKPTIPMLATGQVEFAIVSADEIAIARDRGMDLVGLFAVYQTCPQGLIAHAERNFTRMEDIFQPGRGADGQPITLAVEEGLPYVKHLRDRYGFEQVKVVGFAGLGAFLANQNLVHQCFITSEPLRAARAGVPTATFLIADTGYNPYTAVLAARRGFVDRNPRLVRAMLDAVGEGWRAYLDDPSAANQSMAQLNPEMDAALFAESAQVQARFIRDDHTRRHGLGTMTLERWAQLCQRLLELKAIDQPVDPAQCFLDPAKLPQ